MENAWEISRCFCLSHSSCWSSSFRSLLAGVSHFSLSFYWFYFSLSFYWLLSFFDLFLLKFLIFLQLLQALHILRALLTGVSHLSHSSCGFISLALFSLVALPECGANSRNVLERIKFVFAKNSQSPNKLNLFSVVLFRGVLTDETMELSPCKTLRALAKPNITTILLTSVNAN